MIIRQCFTCGKSIKTYPSQLKHGNGKFCSHKCQGLAKRNKIKVICQKCKKPYYIHPSRIKWGNPQFCSQKCYWTEFGNRQRGEKHWRWSGGRKNTSTGYKRIYLPKHPFCDKQGYIATHRAEMEKMLGRFLKSIEVVHHKNKNRYDNRIINLQLFPNSKEHNRFHAFFKKSN